MTGRTEKDNEASTQPSAPADEWPTEREVAVGVPTALRKPSHPELVNDLFDPEIETGRRDTGKAAADTAKVKGVDEPKNTEALKKLLEAGKKLREATLSRAFGKIPENLNEITSLARQLSDYAGSHYVNADDPALRKKIEKFIKKPKAFKAFSEAGRTSNDRTVPVVIWSVQLEKRRKEFVAMEDCDEILANLSGLQESLNLAKSTNSPFKDLTEFDWEDWKFLNDDLYAVATASPEDLGSAREELLKKLRDMQKKRSRNLMNRPQPDFDEYVQPRLTEIDRIVAYVEKEDLAKNLKENPYIFLQEDDSKAAVERLERIVKEVEDLKVRREKYKKASRGVFARLFGR